MITNEQFALEFQAGYPNTLRFILSRSRDLDLAEEITSAAWARGYCKLSQFRSNSTLIKWVNSIAYNIWAQIGREKIHMPTVGIMETEIVIKESFNDHILVKQLLAMCSHSEAEMLYDLYVLGMEPEEIRSKYGLKGGLYRVQAFRAKRKILERMEIRTRIAGKQPDR